MKVLGKTTDLHRQGYTPASNMKGSVLEVEQNCWPEPLCQRYSHWHILPHQASAHWNFSLRIQDNRNNSYLLTISFLFSHKWKENDQCRINWVVTWISDNSLPALSWLFLVTEHCTKPITSTPAANQTERIRKLCHTCKDLEPFLRHTNAVSFTLLHAIRDKFCKWSRVASKAKLLSVTCTISEIHSATCEAVDSMYLNMSKTIFYVF